MTVAESPDASDPRRSPGMGLAASGLGGVARRHLRLHRPLQARTPVQAGLAQQLAGPARSRMAPRPADRAGRCPALGWAGPKLDDTQIQLTPPATYGGPCPRTPFAMNRRFLALARWAAAPHAIIRARFKRLRNPRAAHGSTDALRAARHEAAGVAASKNGDASVALILGSDRRERRVHPELVEGPKDRRTRACSQTPGARRPPHYSPFPARFGRASFRNRAATSALDLHPRHAMLAP